MDGSKTVGDMSSKFSIEPVEMIEVMDEFERLLTKIELYNPHVDKDLIKKAFRFAAVAHAGQRRKSGNPFIYHGVQTAEILADLHLDSVMIACGILHDVVEDTDITINDVEHEFGSEIANIIDGLTKIAGLQLKSLEEQQAENFRKMILHTAKDPRTVVVKFADRLHNMRTLEFLKPEDRERIAHETLEVFAPLAHRFGIYTIKREFEDLSFRWLDPTMYFLLKDKLEQTHQLRDNYLEQFIAPIKQRLDEEKIKHQSQYRLKHLYSIYKKMERDARNIDNIYDILAVRVIVDTVGECYHVLGIVHSIYTPIVMRIKDFIATPKFNMYQSFHTTVVGKNGRMVEVQIRTSDMHQTAETGIAAHWRYKEGKVRPDEIDSYTTWLRRVVDWQKGTPDASEFMHELKMDLFQDEVFVFTPKGDLIQLPVGSTPVDFAFALHSEIGFHCGGAKINGRIAPLDAELRSGQWVDILTNQNKTPNPEWLNTVKTAKARSLIRRWIKRQHFEESKNLGQNMVSKIEKQLEKKFGVDEQQKLLERFHQRTWEQFLSSLGSGDISLQSVRHFFGLIPKTKRDKHPLQKQHFGVSIQGMENLLISYAKCCKPLPGDDVVGFVTRGRGLVIHRNDCENIKNLVDEEDERIIQATWEDKGDAFFVASIRVEGTDRKGFLTDITGAISKANCDIRSANAMTKDGFAIDDFDVDVKNLADLRKLMSEIGKVKGVNRVIRLDTRTHEKPES